MASEPPFTTADFHNVIQKDLVNAVMDVLEEAKLPWDTIRPFLETARAVCRSDFLDGGARLRLLGVQAAADGGTEESEEAYLALAVHDRDDGQAWLQQSYWLSDLAIGNGDPDEVRRTIRALYRTTGKLQEWLEQAEKQAGEPEGPPEAEA